NSPQARAAIEAAVSVARSLSGLPATARPGIEATVITPVVQEEVSGCGIAACAALARVGYGEAKAVANGLGIYAEDKALWSDTRYVRDILAALGVSAGVDEIPFGGWEELPDRALLAIRWRLER